MPVARLNSPLWQRFVDLRMPPAAAAAWANLFPPATLRLCHLFKRCHVDALHLHRTADLAPALTAAAMAGVPNRVLTLRPESRRIKRGFYYRWIYGRLTAVLTLTDRMAERARAELPVESGWIRRLYNAVDIDALREEAEARPVIRQRWGIPQDAFVAGLIGRVDTGRGQHLLIKATASLRTVIPKLYVMIAGEETAGPTGEINRLKALIGEMGMTDRVIFTGVSQLTSQTAPAFDVMVETLRKESIGSALIEAQALGTPAIGANGGSVPEIVEHEKTGLLFQSEDYEDLAEKLYHLYRDHRLRAELGRQAEATARDKFSVTRHIEGLEAAMKGSLKV